MSTTPNRGYLIPNPAESIFPQVRDMILDVDNDVKKSLSGSYNVKSYGAIGDGSVDDTASIQAALTAAQTAGGVVFVPPGLYLVSANLVITKSIVLRGIPGRSVLLVKATVSSTTDIVVFRPTGGTYQYPTKADNRYFIVNGISVISENAAAGPFNYLPPLGTGGRYAIVLDPGNAGGYMHNFQIQNCYLGLLNGTASIRLAAGPTVNSNDIFTGLIGPNNILERGIEATALGDTVRVCDNNIRGTEYAVNVSSFMGGATTLNIVGNNIISDKGIRLVGGGSGGGLKVNLVDNVIELFQQGTSTPGSNGAVVDLSQLLAVTVRDNVIGSGNPATANLDGVRLDSCTVASIRDNAFSVPTGKFGIKPVSAAQSIQRQHNLVLSGGAEIDTSVDATGQAMAVLFDSVPAGVQAGVMAVANARISSLHVGVTEISATGSISPTEGGSFHVNATGGAITLTLPALAATSQGGRVLKIIKTDSSGNTVTIQRAGSDVINGATSFVLSAQYKFVNLDGNASGGVWFIFGSN